jgi:hypothetical protein
VLSPVHQAGHNGFAATGVHRASVELIAVHAAVGGSIKKAVFDGNTGTYIIAKASGIINLAILVFIAQANDACAALQPLQLNINIAITVHHQVPCPAQVFGNRR